jgi:hypothetical protein
MSLGGSVALEALFEGTRVGTFTRASRNLEPSKQVESSTTTAKGQVSPYPTAGLAMIRPLLQTTVYKRSVEL